MRTDSMPHTTSCVVRKNSLNHVGRIGASLALLGAFFWVGWAGAQERPVPHSGGGTAAQLAAVSDTSVMSGNGLNILGGPIFRKTPEGMLRKEPGSRTWTTMQPVSREQMQAQRRQLHLRRLARDGDKPVDIVIQLRDTADVNILRMFGINLTEAPPCTASVRARYRQLDSLKEQGTIFWLPGQRNPGALPQVRRDGGQPGMPSLPRPPAHGVNVEGRTSVTSTTIWSDNFETYAVPGTNWTVYDNDSYGGYDYWGRNTTGCGYVLGGTYSVHCAYNGDAPCLQYAPGQWAEMDQTTAVNVSGYSGVAVQVNANYSINDYDEYGNPYDVFNIYFDTGTGFDLYETRYGNSNGWKGLVYYFSSVSTLRMAFEFESDDSNTQNGYGVYLDDVSIVGTPLWNPDLTYYVPGGWAAPLVPSSITGTTSVGTLYAGEPTYLDWSIINGDAGSAGGFNVNLFLDGTTPLGSRYVSSLAAYTPYSLQDDIVFATSILGDHRIRMVVDSLPSPQVVESNEGNNGITRTFTWVQRADLTIQSVTVTPTTPLVGQTADIAVTIRNSGTENITGMFYLDLYQNPVSPPSPPSPPIGDATSTVFSLNGNTSTTIHFFRTSQVATTWHMYFYVDPTRLVQEAPSPGNCPSNECNNAFGPVNVLWNSGSLAVSGRFVYDDSLAGTNLPVRGVRVKIFDQDPGGTDDLLAETHTDETGNFGPVNLANDDADVDHGLLDIYAVAEFTTSTGSRGSQAVVMHDAGGNPWSMQTPVAANAANGPLTFSAQKPADSPHRRALHIYHTLLRGYDWVVGHGNTPSPVIAEWFPGNNEHTSYDSLSTSLSINSAPGLSSRDEYCGPDDYDDYPILHEYGHHIAYMLHVTTVSGGGSGLNIPIPPPLAWSEGWADWFASQTVLASPTSLLRDWNQYTSAPGDTAVQTRDLETGIIMFRRDPEPFHGNEEGEDVIPGVFSTLWDLSDAVNDNQPPNACGDELSDPVSRTWQTATVHSSDPMNQLCDFRNLYFKTFIRGNTAATAHFNNTFCEHGVTCGGTLDVEPGPADGRLWLSSAWPNPARGSSRLQFRIPAESAGRRVSLEVYDVAGARMKTLFEGQPLARDMETSWDGRSDGGDLCPAGIYFIRLLGGGRQLSTTLVRLK